MLTATIRLHVEAPNTNVASAQTLKKSIEHQLKDCPSNTYVVVSQPGVSPNDLSVSKSTPHLRRRLSSHDAKVKSLYTVKNVVGDVNAMSLVGMVEASCGRHSSWNTLFLHGQSTSLSLIQPTHLRQLLTTLQTERSLPSLTAPYTSTFPNSRPPTTTVRQLSSKPTRT
jgi:hypothetical protein